MNPELLRRYKVDYVRTNGLWARVCTVKGGYPITINGHVFFIGYVKEKRVSGWRVTERITGTWVGKLGLPSFDAAVDTAVNAFKKNGEDTFLKAIAKLLKEKPILSHPRLLAQRYSDYTPILELTVCKEEEKE